ncbi:hypothetical protein NP233_g8342 [Leucocoprinus birnbaumii]|uniref:3-phytase n=1 Tax=Leucocoprinus birnbaumii TaxID=56174 RepID=A0AAD5VQ48_9AGAR|nr:hypothetical protein NP233_g8342 [Leucocoprinus birnbaumii]
MWPTTWSSVYLFALFFCSQYALSQRQASLIADSLPLDSDRQRLDGVQVGFSAPTGTGDKAAAIEAPIPSHNHSSSPGLEDATSILNVIQYFGNLSPWRSIPSTSYGLPEASPLVPDGCQVVQVHLLYRHGARYPAQNSNVCKFADKVYKKVDSPEGLEAYGEMEFLKTWKNRLGEETLTPFGQAQLFDLAISFMPGKLLKDFKPLPVFRTTSQPRMLDSALSFASGFFGSPSYPTKYHLLTQLESRGINNTLSPNKICPNSHNEISRIGMERYADRWVQKYLKGAKERLEKLVPGFELSIWDCLQMQQLCAFETVAGVNGGGTSSGFCKLFTEEEWRGYSYANALQMWYISGPGSPTSAALGKGWVQEMLSRLTKTRITTFDSSVNQTIVHNETLFPLNQPMYVDATHDTVMSAVYVAMNFTNFIRSGPLPADRMPYNLSYKMDEVMPFAANLIGQALSCPSLSPSPPPPSSPKSASNATHIRWILNDGVLPLTGIHGCPPNEQGLCDINDFVRGMKKRVEEIDFAWGCFGRYEFPEPDLIVDGRLPVH